MVSIGGCLRPSSWNLAPVSKHTLSLHSPKTGSECHAAPSLPYCGGKRNRAELQPAGPCSVQTALAWAAHE